MTRQYLAKKVSRFRLILSSLSPSWPAWSRWPKLRAFAENDDSNFRALFALWAERQTVGVVLAVHGVVVLQQGQETS